MKLGNAHDARLIYNRRKTGAGPLPKGWKKLGAGAYRTSYLSPDKVVYKVCHPGEGHHWNNFEFNNFKKIRMSKARLPKGWRVASTKMYSFDDGDERVHIIAMQYVEGTHIKISYSDDDLDSIFEELGATKAFNACNIWDMHEENFMITPDGKKVIIDLGE